MSAVRSRLAPDRLLHLLAIASLLFAPGAPGASTTGTGSGRDLSVRGQVLDAVSGLPLSAARVTLESISPRSVAGGESAEKAAADTKAGETRTDESGRFALTAPRFGAWRVVVRVPGRVPVARELVPLLVPTELAPVTPPVDRGLTLRAVDDRGAPRPATSVTLVPRSHDEVWADLRAGGWRPASRWGVTGDDGQIHLPSPAGEHPLVLLDASAENGGELVEPSPRELANGKVEVRRSPVGSEADSSHRTPAAGPRVATGRLVTKTGPVRGLVWVDPDPGAAERTGDDGRFRSIVPPDARWLIAAAPGHLPRVVPLTAIGMGETIELEPALRISGGVVDDRGEPVPGARVEAVLPPLPPGSPERLRVDRPARTWTGADGRFLLGLLPRRARYELSVSRPGHESVRTSVAPTSGEGAVTLVLPRDRAAFGRVLDGAGGPVAGARVRLSAENRHAGATAEAETGDDGRFELSGLEPGRFLLHVRHPDHAAVRVPGLAIPFAPGRTDLGTVHLPPPAPAAGRVVSEHGVPVPGVRVSAHESSIGGGTREILEQTETADDGSFELTGLEPGVPIDLHFAKRGFAEEILLSVEVPTPLPLEVALGAGHPLSGRVIDEAGDPVADARVEATDEETAGRPVGTTTGPDGRFALADLPPAPHRLVARHEGFVPANRDGVHPGGVEEIELILRTGASIAGRTVDTDGEAVRGARVAVAAGGPHTPVPFAVGAGRGETGADGSFRIAGLVPGTRVLEARHPDHPISRREIDLQPGENRVTLVLEPGITVTGRVTDLSGAPVPDARVEPISDAEGVSARTGPDGTFRLTGLAPGTVGLRAAKRGWAPAVLEAVEVSPPGVAGVELVLERGTVVSGRIHGVDPRDLARLRVTATDLEAEALQGTVDHAGYYRVVGVSEGEWWIAAEAPDGRRAAERIEVLPGDRQVAVDLDLARRETVRGRVSLAGEPVPGAEVSIAPVGGRAGSAVYTDHAGRFELATEEAGAALLRVVSASRGISHEEELAVPPGREVLVELSGGALSGVVADAATEQPIAGAAVILLRDGTPVRRTRTDDGGAFSLDRLQSGAWTLRADAAAHSPEELALDLPAGEPIAGIQLRLRATDGLDLDLRTAAGTTPHRIHAVLLDSRGRAVAGGTYPVDDRGRVHLADAPSGRWRCLVASEGTETTGFPVTVPGSPPTVTLHPSGTLDVRLRDSPNPGHVVQVTALDASGNVVLRVGPGGRIETSSTALLGRARIPGLTTGTYRLVAHGPNGASWSGRATVRAGTTVAVTLEPSGGGAR